MSFMTVAVVLVAGPIGCLSTSEAITDPDDQFGHRVAGETPDGRNTIIILPPEADRTYNFFPATYQTVNVRSSSAREEAGRNGSPVEILVKGAFPDACTELHDVNQERAGNVIRVALRMRRPTGAVCASVLRPYRFYLELEGLYVVGAYSLILNGNSIPFEIRVLEDS
ncbi:MAG: hypothetical protein BMS9Abin05_2417 [Rhodothermia bacterium]|nr:MAG: hypothetical protein BMS9Abin05_2417 [Rhodothermia bacterium]